MYIDSEDFLEHYGVKGMRWGVRKKDDQTSASVSTNTEKPISKRREEKAKEYDAKAARLNKQINAIKPENRDRLQDHITWLEKERDQAQADAQALRSGTGLTPTQKKIVKGAAVAAGILAVYGGYRLVQSGQMNKSIMQGKAFIQRRGNPPFKTNDILASKDLDLMQLDSLVVSKINPDYGTPGTKVNCRRCTFAYELRRRGYDVAATRTTTGYGQNAGGLFNAVDVEGKNVSTGKFGMMKNLATEVYKKQVDDETPTPLLDLAQNFGAGAKTPIDMIPGQGGSSIFDALRKQPNGARGEVVVSWLNGGAHSMAWEVVNGKPVIFDTQTRKTHLEIDSSWKKMGSIIGSAGFTRLDNVDLDYDFLLRWVKDG